MVHVFSIFESIRWSALLPAVFALLTAGHAGAAPPAAEDDSSKEAAVEVQWRTSYAEAAEAAKQQGKMLLIYFRDSQEPAACEALEQGALADEAVRLRLRDYVCLRLPLKAEVKIDDEPVALLKHASLAEMLRRPGVAILDFARGQGALADAVISTFPLTEKFRYTAAQMRVILDLPPGTLSQRTLIYAVRVHPDKPASTAGDLSVDLAEEAELHARYQARIRVQGHQHFATRSRRMARKLPPGTEISEVCAESWPGEHLVEAAVECVRCWRLSSGHWSAVRARQSVYGYDMQRGSNRIWYATGVFGRR